MRRSSARSAGLRTTVEQIRTELQAALDTLSGESGVLGTGIITGEQTITNAGGVITARATASIDELTLLGQDALAGATVLQTISTATVNGTPGSAEATLESTVADVTAGDALDPFAQVRATINGVSGNLGEGPLGPELGTVLRHALRHPQRGARPHRHHADQGRRNAAGSAAGGLSGPAQRPADRDLRGR